MTSHLVALFVGLFAAAPAPTPAAPAAAAGSGADFTPTSEDLGYDNTVMKPRSKFHIHDRAQPRPPVVMPGTFSTQEKIGDAPSDAIVLFRKDDDLQKNWVHTDGTPPTWVAKNGEFTVGKMSVRTKEEFTDFQLHLEYIMPSPDAKEGATGQHRGNSGLFLLGKYEIQILDNYKSDTYADGQCGSMYGEYPPMVNACRPPHAWQSYDVIFIAPRFSAGKLTRPARVTVLHNGVAIHVNKAFNGPTSHKRLIKYREEFAKGPIALQDHRNPVRYRNIWLRPLKAYEGYEGGYTDDDPALVPADAGP